MEYKHFITAFIGGLVVTAACLAEYGVNAPTVIFCTQWMLVCQTWFVTTLPAMNNIMRGLAWLIFLSMCLLLGRQIPYMLNSPRVGESFLSFMFVMIVFLGALIASAHLPEKEKMK